MSVKKWGNKLNVSEVYYEKFLEYLEIIDIFATKIFDNFINSTKVFSIAKCTEQMLIHYYMKHLKYTYTICTISQLKF